MRERERERKREREREREREKEKTENTERGVHYMERYFTGSFFVYTVNAPYILHFVFTPSVQMQ